MTELKRRKFLKAATLGAGSLIWADRVRGAEAEKAEALELMPGGRDFSLVTMKERATVPSTCWQCVTRCPIIGYLENGRLVKIEGNPLSSRTRGKLCARGQAGVNQLYDPDRLLFPLKRVGARGEGRWQRISWEDALGLLVDGGEIAGRRVKGLRQLREEGTPEKFMFHYGRTVGSDWMILMGYFLPAYGTGTIGDHSSICLAAGAAASGLTGGSRFTDFEKARIILNFGGSVLEAHVDHVPTAQRCVDALARGVKMYTFDVRLSNTAATSTEWIPVKSGTDLAVILALCNVILTEGLYDGDAIRDYTNVTVEELERHLSAYTPEWAEEISGVPASKIRDIALEFGRTKPGICLSFRGAFMHHNGVQTQRAIYMLQAIAGNLDPEGRRGAPARWQYPFPQPEGSPRALNILRGEEGAYALPDMTVSHQVLRMIDKGPDRPEIYMVYCHNPVYSNGDCSENARVFMDEEKIPFLVSVDVAMSETSELADLILPDATYLERWTCEGRTSAEGIPEYCLQQPMHAPRGEARNFCDVACDIAARLDLDLGFRSAEEYVRAACESTPGVKEAGGFDHMKRHGIWRDTSAEPLLLGARKMNIRSEVLAGSSFDAIPAWMPVPEHERMVDEDLILTTFKVPVQTHSRTQNCKWLTELHHDNPAWIHPRTAGVRGIKNGDRIIVSSPLGEIMATARVTQGVHPKAVAMSHHCGHWAYGGYASGRRSHGHPAERDLRNKWWKGSGAHPNRIIPNKGDPIAGSMCWNDTVVKVSRA
jgi:anaerobic selenocysteine-containing dehydrogenase